MKASTTSISFSLLFFLLGLESASASWGFSFGNLMFSLHMCRVPGPNGCNVKCHGPLKPKNYCDNQCASSNSTNFTYSTAACENLSSTYYDKCIAGATADCTTTDSSETTTDSDASYVEGSSYADETNTQSGTPNASRMSFLPYIIAATVATMFLGLYVWKKKRDQREELQNEDLLGDESFHGSVARRISKIGKRKDAVSSAAKPDIDTGSTGYALA